MPATQTLPPTALDAACLQVADKVGFYGDRQSRINSVLEILDGALLTRAQLIADPGYAANVMTIYLDDICREP